VFLHFGLTPSETDAKSATEITFPRNLNLPIFRPFHQASRKPSGFTADCFDLFSLLSPFQIQSHGIDTWEHDGVISTLSLI